MRLLLVEDERRLCDRLARGLREEGFAVDCAVSAATARERASEASYDVVLLDLGLPDGSGIDLLKRWRRETLDVPVLILTAHDLVEGKVEGLNAGADDYLTKPFAFEEVLARVRALLRRRAAPQRSVVKVGALTLDRDGRRVEKDGEPLDLTRKELELLEYFMLHPGVVLSRDRIAEHVWDQAYEARSNTIDVIVTRLRHKIESGGARLIHSVPGVGYVLRPSEESVERMRRFMADASHEIRNPLTVLRTGIEIFLRRERTAGEYEALLRENLQEIERLQTAVEGILLLARDVPGSEMRIASAAVDLGQVARATAAFFGAAADERGVTIDVEAEPGILVDGDAGLLRLVVSNLLDNALKHNPDGEPVRLAVRRQDDGGVSILVADRGPGVRPADRDRVFERFFRGGPVSVSGAGGIGLSVVRWIAEAHGGAARLLDSERGAAFEVVLPALA